MDSPKGLSVYYIENETDGSERESETSFERRAGIGSERGSMGVSDEVPVDLGRATKQPLTGPTAVDTTTGCDSQDRLASRDIFASGSAFRVATADDPGGTENSAATEKKSTTAATSGACWKQLAFGSSNVPQQRAAHSCDLIDGNKLFVFGGWNGKQALNDLHMLDLKSMVWTCLNTENSPPERNNHSTAVVNTRIFLHGGHDGSRWLDDLYIFDADHHCWAEVSFWSRVPAARACHTLSYVHNKLYMFGGYDGSRCFNDMDVLDLNTQTWIRPVVTGKLPQPRNAHTVTVVDTKLILFGGHSGSKHLTDLHIFETIELQWIQPDVRGTPPPGLRGHTATLAGDRVVLFGGYDGKGRSNRIVIFETNGFKWFHPQEIEAAPIGRQRHSASLIGLRRLIVFGGFDGSKWLNDVHELDVAKLSEGALFDGTMRLLVKNLRALLLEDPVFSDVSIVVQGREIKAHRNILAAQSSYFNSMFRAQMMEAKERCIEIPEKWSYEGVKGMLEFLYTGKLSTELSAEALCDMLGLAELYALDALKALCETSLKHSVEAENVCQLFVCADEYRAAELKKFCENFIMQHALEVTP